MPTQLADGFHKGGTLDISDSATHLRDDEVEFLTLLVLAEHTPLDLVGDMGHDLYRLTEVVAMPLAVDDGLIDAPRGDTVVTGGMNTCKPFVVTQVQVGLETVIRHVALTMLVGVQRPWVDVDVGVELLDGHLVTTCL